MGDLENNIFMLAGPVKIHPRVLRVMSLPSMAHRSKDFENVNAEIRELLKYIFQTKNDVALLTGSGTAGVEAAISNLIRKGDKILTINNGKFGERLGEIGNVFGETIEVKFEWGKPAEGEKVAAVLEENRVRAMAFVHNETSTGLTNQAKELADLARKHDVLLILDAITAIGGIDVRPDEWGADITIFGSQKCVAAPAGLAGLCVSERAKQMMYNDTSYYLNVKEHIEKLKENDTPWTPAIPLFLAMREALRMIKEEGLENRIKRTSALADATRSAVDALGLQLFPEREYASNTLTAIRYPEGIVDKNFRATLRDKYNVIIAGAQDHIKGKVFRIGHMGICSFNDLVATFAAIETTLKQMGYPVKTGSAVGAIVERM